MKKSNRFYVSTRKGLFTVARKRGKCRKPTEDTGGKEHPHRRRVRPLEIEQRKQHAHDERANHIDGECRPGNFQPQRPHGRHVG